MKTEVRDWSSGPRICGGRDYKEIVIRDESGACVAYALCENEREFHDIYREFEADFSSDDQDR